MNSTVENILKNHYVDGVFHTHVSMVQPKGKFQFNKRDLEDFWTAYSEKIKNENAIIGVAEKPQYYLPVLVDIDLKIKDTDQIDFKEHLYNEEHVNQLLEIYQSTLRNIVEDCTDEQLTCVLLEKPIYYINAGNTTYIKNGFHLHFPNLFLNKVDQEIHLIPRVQETVKELELFLDLGYEDSSKVIDKASCTVPWLMYGSRKSEDMDPYKITKIFNSDGYEITLEEAFRNYELYDSNEDLITLENNIEKYLPRILSILPYGRQTYELKQGLISPLKEKHNKMKSKRNTNNTKPLNFSVSQNLKVSEALLPMLKNFRASEYSEWMTIGWLLFSISDGCPEGLDLWLEFSSKCADKYDESSCIYHWERMIRKEYTIKTLHYFAKQDNPEKYNEYIKNQCETHIRESLNGSHNDIAKLLKVKYQDEFVCASITNKIWFQFTEHKWEEIEEGVFLRQRISSEIVEKYAEKACEIFQKLSKVKDKMEEGLYNVKIKEIQKLIGKLKSSPFKKNIMNEAMEVFYDRKFKHKLNQNPFIIGFKNGVYDLQTNKFRDGRPEDFISKNCPIDYKEFNLGDEEVQNVIEFLQKVFPDTSIRNYFLDMYSDIFVGGNSQKKVLMWTGEGDNGKSITQALFEKMLGELAIKFNTQYFTGKKVSTGSANPELVRAAPPVRHVTMEEPDADEQLNIGELKKLSGGDSFWARDLFEKGKNTREIFPQFMLTFICNKLPKLKYSDKATWNRIRVIPFESTFVEPSKSCPITFEEQLLQKRFPMDKQFNKKIPGMVQAFAWYLLEWRKNITVRVEPEKVRQATEIYRQQNDIYRQFVEECIVEDKALLSLTELYSHFKDWFKEGFPNMTLPIKNEVYDYFERLWGEPMSTKKWNGYRIRTLQDDIKDGSVIILEESDLIDYENETTFMPPL